MIELLLILQVAFAAVWTVVLTLLSPSLWHVLRGRADLLDIVRAPQWFVALVMVMQSIRWLVFRDTLPLMGWDELAFWNLIYLVGIGAGIGVASGVVLGERLR